MAVQINEKHLSPLAREEIYKVKNKSQFVRDAIEYYVRRGEIKQEQNEIRAQLREIRLLLSNLTSQPKSSSLKSNKVLSKIGVKVLSEEDKNDAMAKPDTQGELYQPGSQLATSNNDIQGALIGPKDILHKNTNHELSHEEKEQIEKMLDDSINIF